MTYIKLNDYEPRFKRSAKHPFARDVVAFVVLAALAFAAGVWL